MIHRPFSIIKMADRDVILEMHRIFIHILILIYKQK